MKNIIFLLFCVFGLTTNAQLVEGMLIGREYHKPKKTGSVYLGFNLAPQVYTVDFKKPQQTIPVHALVWYEINENVTIAGGYTVLNDNIVTAVIVKNHYFVFLHETTGKVTNGLAYRNFLAIGHTFPVPKTQASLFLEFGMYAENPIKTILSAGVFIPFKIQLGHHLP